MLVAIVTDPDVYNVDANVTAPVAYRLANVAALTIAKVDASVVAAVRVTDPANVDPPETNNEDNVVLLPPNLVVAPAAVTVSGTTHDEARVTGPVECNVDSVVAAATLKELIVILFTACNELLSVIESATCNELIVMLLTA